MMASTSPTDERTTPAKQSEEAPAPQTSGEARATQTTGEATQTTGEATQTTGEARAMPTTGEARAMPAKQTKDEPPPRRDRRGLFWALVPVILLTGLLGTQLLLLSSALDDPSFAVEERYYEKATSWDAKMAQDQENARLGWRVEVAPLAMGPSAAVSLSIVDPAGERISGATVTLEAFANARAGRIHKATLEERIPGRYETTLELARPGLWELRLDARRGVDHFTATVRKDVFPEGRR